MRRGPWLVQDPEPESVEPATRAYEAQVERRAARRRAAAILLGALLVPLFFVLVAAAEVAHFEFMLWVVGVPGGGP